MATLRCSCTHMEGEGCRNPLSGGYNPFLYVSISRFLSLAMHYAHRNLITLFTKVQVGIVHLKDPSCIHLPTHSLHVLHPIITATSSPCPNSAICQIQPLLTHPKFLPFSSFVTSPVHPPSHATTHPPTHLPTP